jgi:AcrR family transcriptional regulator
MSDLTEAMAIGSPSLYAAFGSKEALYSEAVRYYVDTYEGLVWDKFKAAPSAREAIQGYLLDSAAALTGALADNPRGCMVALSSVGSEGHSELGALVRTERGSAFKRIKARLEQAIEEEEIPPTDAGSLARFIQGVQYGMSILARDGIDCSELTAVAEIAMLGWDARVHTG